MNKSSNFAEQLGIWFAWGLYAVGGAVFGAVVGWGVIHRLFYSFSELGRYEIYEQGKFYACVSGVALFFAGFGSYGQDRIFLGHGFFRDVKTHHNMATKISSLCLGLGGAALLLIFLLRLFLQSP